MKKFSKFLGIMLILALVMSMGISALAEESYPYPPTDNTDPGNYTLADTTTFSITIPKTAADKENEVEHTYGAYQIFKGDLYVETENGTTTKTLSNIAWGSGVDSTKIPALMEALAANSTLSGLGITSDMTAAQVAEKLDGLAFDANAAKEFAAVVSGYLGAASATSVEDGDNYVMSNLYAGYYFVKDLNENSEFDQENYAQTRYMLEVVGNVTAKPKQSVPTLVKKVDDVNDSTDITNTVNWQDSADYDIGDKVPYEITTTLPENIADYTEYKMIITDKMEKGLTYNDDARVYFVYPGFDFWVEVNDHPNVTVSKDDDQSFTVTISDVKSVTGGFHSLYNPQEVSGMLGRMGRAGNFVQEVLAGTKIVVRYSATLNKDAVIGPVGNKNDAQLEYSNNPNGVGTGKTPKDTNIVFTYEVDVNKVERDDSVAPIDAATYEGLADKTGWARDSSGNYYKTKPLTGADFTLYKKVTDSKIPGAQTGAAIYNSLNAQIKSLAKSVFENNDNYYIVVDQKTGTTAGAEFTFKGVDDGEYVLLETTVPAGYNGITATPVTVTATHSNDDAVAPVVPLTLTSLQVNNESGFTVTDPIDGTIKADIENNKGTVLPSTGGIGTTIFYVVGGILVVAAGVLLITKKRMSE